jgi:hypothetical protein
MESFAGWLAMAVFPFRDQNVAAMAAMATFSDLHNPHFYY